MAAASLASNIVALINAPLSHLLTTGRWGGRPRASLESRGRRVARQAAREQVDDELDLARLQHLRVDLQLELLDIATLMRCCGDLEFVLRGEEAREEEARLARLRGVAARAENRRFGCLSALHAHTKAPHKTDLHRKTLTALNRPGTARTAANASGRSPK